MFNLVDMVALLFVLLHVVLSWRRGLSEEIARVLGAMLAFWLGLRYQAVLESHDDNAFTPLPRPSRRTGFCPPWRRRGAS